MDGKEHWNVDFESELSLGLGFSLLSKRNYFLSELTLGFIVFRYSFFFFFLIIHLVEEMATHSSVLAWSIPGTAGPGGLPSMGSQRVGHD